MAAVNGKSRCSICGKEKRAVRCEGCLHLFCYDHLTDHRKDLNKELDHIELARDLFQDALEDQRNHPHTNSLIQQIDQWEEESIKIIQQSAKKCRQSVIQYTTKNIYHIEVNLSKLSEHVKKIRHENDFNEIDIDQMNQKLRQLQQQFDQPPDVCLQQDSTPFISKVSVIVSPERITPARNIYNKTTWKHNGSTIAGGYGEGYKSNQLHWPYGICIDDDDHQNIFIADYGNDRVVKWVYGANHGHVVAGGNGKGNRLDQLNLPTDIVLDRKTDSLIICDSGNRRVVRWFRRNDRHQQILISHIACSRLTIDRNGDVYVSDCEKHEVRRYREGDTNGGTIVAGGHGKGDHLNQLNAPTYVFIDQDHSVYVSDTLNHRVMKWTKGAKEGTIVAGGQGEGNSLVQLWNPQGVIVDPLGNVYVSDSWNHRIVRWLKGSRKSSIVVGGNGQGQQPDQINCPLGLSFDRQGNLYVVDWGNHRAQKFDVD